jgi:cell wall-associated NlpC family hydrolase
VRLNLYHFSILVFLLVFFTSCSSSRKTTSNEPSKKPIAKPISTGTTTTATKAKTFTKPVKIDRAAFVDYAKTFIGTPYKYGSTNPQNGLDCSGFIMVVFGHFNVKTPRVSKDFANEGVTIDIKEAKPGDIILFTGSDNSTGIVGHMGIITSAGAIPQFISSTSGKNIGVVESKLTGYWKTHFVKVIRVLE